ncbi:MAG: aminotransferase class I/II-fold pyridoxal phosphate-dependent enzyme [Clostridiales bacterium]|nr:aminotransferase class I/II-fold pyridoxal phosphate-dependent enzyme [Clostridiales bacterium]
MIRLNCDYLEGCHPAILRKLTETNLEQTVGYGMDPYCQQAAGMIREAFACPEGVVHFLVGGTQANATVIAAALRPYEGVLCAETGHINVHETGAIEASGHKCLVLPQFNGKITARQVADAVAAQGDDEHMVKPGMVYISLSTELGTLYSRQELEALYTTCQELGLYLYIDGARLGYALTAPACDLTPADVARFSDAFTIGGTKVGALFGEAVVISNPELNRNFRYMIKQHGGMLAKGRLLGLQFIALMEDGLYFSIAKKAVAQALRIREALVNKGVPFFIDSPTNQLFPIFSDAQAEAIARDFELALWERVDNTHVAMRVCTSWATPDAYVDAFITAIEKL